MGIGMEYVAQGVAAGLLCHVHDNGNSKSVWSVGCMVEYGSSSNSVVWVRSERMWLLLGLFHVSEGMIWRLPGEVSMC